MKTYTLYTPFPLALCNTVQCLILVHWNETRSAGNQLAQLLNETNFSIITEKKKLTIREPEGIKGMKRRISIIIEMQKGRV